MPAQSPTLSPTLSAITAGLRGSSSGMPASTLPTRSAPTSAALVKMPPPRRAKTEISEPPKPRPIRASIASLSSSPARTRIAEVAGDAEQREADDQQAGDRAALEGGVERRRHAAASGLGHACVRAHRDVHADEAGRAGEHAADDEADAGRDAAGHERHDDRERNGDAGDDRVLAVQVGLGALLDGAGDLLHPLVAGGERQQTLGHERPVEDRGARADQRDQDAVVGQEVSQVSFPSVGWT